jgi:hypothetical protein
LPQGLLGYGEMPIVDRIETTPKKTNPKLGIRLHPITANRAF